VSYINRQRKDGVILLWVKRLVPFILMVAVVLGYFLYHDISAKRQYQQVQRYALVTAQVWIATAKFRSEPERFIAYRDSLLKVHSLSEERMQNYLEQYKKHPERYDLFTRLVKQYVDSLSAIKILPLEDSTATKAETARVTK